MYAGPDLMNLEDSDLLVRAAAGSRDALAEIARRYVGFVYAAALRQVRDPHLAEDVTQAVFVILARKVGHIRPGTLLHGWLFATTRYAAANAMKMQNRRQFHERRAAAMREQQRQACCDDSHWVEPLLDDALAQLRESDRNAVLLSYMAGKSWREVAASLGTTEEAARKRVTRAVAQLRGMVARRGVATTGAAIAAVLTTSAEASVPPTLLGSVTAALASTTGGAGGAAAAGSASSIHREGSAAHDDLGAREGRRGRRRRPPRHARRRRGDGPAPATHPTPRARDRPRERAGSGGNQARPVHGHVPGRRHRRAARA